ncbi:hypothetical protein D3C71_2020360 [compost metagenome]
MRSRIDDAVAAYVQRAGKNCGRKIRSNHHIIAKVWLFMNGNAVDRFIRAVVQIRGIIG